MDDLFIFEKSAHRHTDVQARLDEACGELGTVTRFWFEWIRNLDEDITELIHDGHLTACVNQAAFCYVGQFKAHVTIGFYRGAELDDPMNLLQGSGKYMRHVKIKLGDTMDVDAVSQLIRIAYQNMKKLSGQREAR